MTLDEAILALQEAKEHGVQGGRKVLLVDEYSGDCYDVRDIVYDNRNVTIKF